MAQISNIALIANHTGLGARWVSISDRLRICGQINLPKELIAQGTVSKLLLTRHEIDVGLWLMPDNQIPRILEQFVQFLIPPEDNLVPHVKASIQQIPTEKRRFAPEKLSKAEIHTWLAWQKEPGKPLGQSITARYLNANAPHARLFIDWVQAVFDL